MLWGEVGCEQGDGYYKLLWALVCEHTIYILPEYPVSCTLHFYINRIFLPIATSVLLTICQLLKQKTKLKPSGPPNE